MAEALRLGGTDAITLFLETCITVRESEGSEAAARWIESTLPILPETERAEVVRTLIEALASQSVIEFKSYPSTGLH
jgi:hypothetical protein